MAPETRTQASRQQPSIEPDDASEDLPASPPNDQLITAADNASVSLIPGFSQQQFESLERLFTRKFNDFFDRFQKMQQMQNSKNSQDSPPIPSIESAEPAGNRRERRRQLRAADGQDGQDHLSDEDFESLPLSIPPTKSPPFRAEDIGFFDPGFQPEQEHGKTTPGPVVNAGKHVYYLDVFVFVDRLKELARKHGPAKVIDLIPSCLRGTALVWWTVEVDDLAKELLEGSKKLEQWTTILIKQFRTMPTEALTALCSSTYTLQDLQRGISPRIWIHGQLHLARSAELDSVFNQLTIIYGRMAPYFQEQLDPPSPTTKLSDFLHKVDMRTPAWRSRAAANQQRQSRGFQPQGSYQDRQRDPQRDSQPNRPASQSQSQAEPHRRGVHFDTRPKLYRGKEHGKQAYSYMVGTLEDGTPQYADDDPDDDDDHAENG